MERWRDEKGEGRPQVKEEGESIRLGNETRRNFRGWEGKGRE